jgi:hypothetical protein
MPLAGPLWAFVAQNLPLSPLNYPEAPPPIRGSLSRVRRRNRERRVQQLANRPSMIGEPKVLRIAFAQVANLEAGHGGRNINVAAHDRRTRLDATCVINALRDALVNAPLTAAA